MVPDSKEIDLKMFEKLADKRILRLPQLRVNSDNAWLFANALILMNLQDASTPITCEINSPGGDIEASFLICNYMQILPAPVHGIVTGRCDSAAVVVLQCCQKRLALEMTSFLLHFGKSSFAGIDIEPDQERTIQNIREEQFKVMSHYERILASRTGKTVDDIKNLMRDGSKYSRRLDAAEAKDLGLIDEIVTDFKLLA